MCCTPTLFYQSRLTRSDVSSCCLRELQRSDGDGTRFGSRGSQNGSWPGWATFCLQVCPARKVISPRKKGVPSFPLLDCACLPFVLPDYLRDMKLLFCQRWSYSSFSLSLQMQLEPSPNDSIRQFISSFDLLCCSQCQRNVRQSFKQARGKGSGRNKENASDDKVKKRIGRN